MEHEQVVFGKQFMNIILRNQKKNKKTFVMWYDCTLNLQIPVPETVSSVPPVDFEFEFEILFALPQWV